MAKKNLPAATGEAPTSFSVAEVLGLPANATDDELIDIGIQALNMAGLHMARAGAAFSKLRNVAQFGDWLETLEKRGLDRTHVQRAIQFHDYIASLPEPDARRMLKVPYTKVLAISRADPEVVADLLASGAIDGDQPLSIRELRERLADEERRANTAEGELEVAKAKLKETVNYQAQLDAKSGLPTWMRTQRVGLMAEVGGVEERLDVIEQLLRTAFLPQPLDNADDDNLRHAAASTASHALAAIAARVNRLQSAITDAYGGALDYAAPLVKLTDAEVSEALKARAYLVDEARNARMTREFAASQALPRGRGRPRKEPTPAKSPKRRG